MVSFDLNLLVVNSLGLSLGGLGLLELGLLELGLLELGLRELGLLELGLFRGSFQSSSAPTPSLVNGPEDGKALTGERACGIAWEASSFCGCDVGNRPGALNEMNTRAGHPIEALGKRHSAPLTCWLND